MIKLTIKHGTVIPIGDHNRDTIYINPDNIISISWLKKDGRTKVDLSNNGSIYIKESPEQILKLIEEIK